ncbi:MAG: anthranilate phosphoribosyltransferase [Xanthomonadaceae bacterium]|nr:anthranilate phosphoribosyltransferase [Xanthomonadaceae bacterium]
MNALLERLYAGVSLSRDDSTALFERVLEGHATPVEMTALLVALKAKGECPDEIAGAAVAMRARAVPFPRPDYAFADTCGTGGSGTGTLNVSTAVAFALAECGLPVAKHGNRAVSSRSGSADVLEALGMRLDPSPAVSRSMLDETGFCFLFAPAYHQGVAHAMPVRKALGTRTIFNLLGPLAHPAAPPVQLLGVYDASLCRPLAETLRQLGCTTALVVHGEVDEIALHGPTRVARLSDGRIDELELHPEDAGIAPRPLAAIEGRDAAHNAAALRRLLAGDGDAAYADAVALNGGALLWVTGRAESFAAGCAAVHEALASGRAAIRLKRAVELSHG